MKLDYGGKETDISSHVFTKLDSDGEGIYVIGYWDTGVGVLFYDYTYIPSGEELLVAAATAIMAALAGVAVGAVGGAGALIPAFV